MPIDAARLKLLIDARDFEEAGRRLPEASAADLAGLHVGDLLRYVWSLSDHDRRALPVHLLRELRNRRPADPYWALFLAAEFVIHGLSADALGVMEMMLDATPQRGSWLWRWINQLVAMGRSADARACLDRLSTRYAGLFGTAMAAVEIAMAERRFAEAAASLERIAVGFPAMADGLRRRMDRARLYDALARRFAAARAAAPDYAVYGINLDEHPLRFAGLRGQLPAERPPLRRVPGVKGRHLPDAAAATLGGATGAAQKGTLGCFLAHVAAWERIARGAHLHALVLEDDVRLVLDLPESIAAFDLPPGYDLCFAGDGTEPEGLPLPTAAPRWIALAEALATKPADWEAPGAFGYFLSRAGATKLLGLVARDGCSGDVDWRLVAYALGKARCRQWPRDHAAFTRLGAHCDRIGPEAALAAWCLSPSLFRPGRIGSTRKTDDRDEIVPVGQAAAPVGP